MLSERKAAPIRMSAIIAEVRTAPISEAAKARADSEPWLAASSNEPMTPNAAASVAVATPAYIEPITALTSTISGMSRRDWASITLSGWRSSRGGTSAGRSSDHTAT